MIEKTLVKEDTIGIFGIIEKVLKENRNTQVFVDSKIINSLIESNAIKSKTYFRANVDGIRNYCYTYFYIPYYDFERTVMYTEILFLARGNSFTEGYTQLLQVILFNNSEEYLYSEVGFEQLLKIDIKK